MAREYVTPPCGRPKNLNPPLATPGRRVKNNLLNVPIEHQEVDLADGRATPRTFTHAGVKNSVTVLTVWVGEDGRFRLLLHEEMKKIGLVVTSASGYLNGKAEEKNPQLAAPRILNGEHGVQVPPEALAAPLVSLTELLLAYPNLTGEAGQQAFGYLLRQAPKVRADRVIWSEDVFPRSIDDLVPWRKRVGRHGPVVAAILSMGQWLTLSGYATPTGEATPAWAALCAKND